MKGYRDPGISVVIPTYNNAESASLALQSILNQTKPVDEIILVDDASSSETRDALKRIAESFGEAVPIRLLLLESNLGPGLARHEGAAIASGEYVAFLDADDQWHRRKVEETLRVIRQHGVGKLILVGHFRPWQNPLREEVLSLPFDEHTERTLTRIDFLMRNPIPTSSIVVSSSVARSMFRFGGRRSEDYMALMVARRMVETVQLIQAPLCWASKPPFGQSGEGADILDIYRASFSNMWKLKREGEIGLADFMIFSLFLGLRIPAGLIRLSRYKRLRPVLEGGA